MKNDKFKVFVLFLNNNKEDKLKDVDNDVLEYFRLTPEFNLSIRPDEVGVNSQDRTKRTGAWCPGMIVSSDSEEKLAQHIEYIKDVLKRHLYCPYPNIPNVVFLRQVGKKEIYSKIPGAVDIKFTGDYRPIPMIVYDDGTTQPLDCERIEKLTKIEHVVACVSSEYDHSTCTNKIHNEMFFAS